MELLQQIRLVEMKHNSLVDEYFQISMSIILTFDISMNFFFLVEEHVQQALKNLNEQPTASNLNIYHQYLKQSESVMKFIRTER